MGTLGKSYSCKICGMAFSCRRVLGGHVRRHLASERLAARDKKLLIVADKSEIDGDAENGVHQQGGHFLRANPKKSVKSLGLNERAFHSLSSKNVRGRCRKGFHVGLHAGVGGRRGERDDDCMPSLDLDTKAEATSRKSLLEEILCDYERIYPMIRKKRSIRASCSGDLSGNSVFSDVNTPSTLLLSDGDEMEAAISLLSISTGVMNWESSAVGNEFLKNSSSVDEKNEEGVSDDFSLGVGNKRRVCEIHDVGLKTLKQPDCIGSFSIFANDEEKLAEHEVSLHVTSGGVEVWSSRKDDVVEDIKTMVVDVLEGERLPNLISDDEVGGDCRKTKFSDPGCRKTDLVFKRTGYKCKYCRNIFPTYEALGGHRVEYRNRTSGCSSLNSDKSENVAVNGEVSYPSPAENANKTFSRYEAGLGEQNHNLAASGKVCTLGRALSGQERSPYSKGSADGLSKRSCYGAVPVDVNAPLKMFGED